MPACFVHAAFEGDTVGRVLKIVNCDFSLSSQLLEREITQV